MFASDLLQRFRERLPTQFEFLSGGPAAGRVRGETFQIVRSGVLPAQLVKVRLKGAVENGVSGSVISCVSQLEPFRLVLTLLAMATSLAFLAYVLVGLIVGDADLGGAILSLAFVGALNASVWIRFVLELRRARRDWTFLIDLVAAWSNGQVAGENEDRAS